MSRPPGTEQKGLIETARKGLTKWTNFSSPVGDAAFARSFVALALGYSPA